MNTRTVVPLSDDEQITATVVVPSRYTGPATPLIRQLVDTCDTVRVVVESGAATAEWPIDLHVQMLVPNWQEDGVGNALTDISSVRAGYHLLMAATVAYASDYVATMVQKIERYRRQAIVGVAGAYVMSPAGLRGMRLDEPLARDLPVHILDVRAIGFHAGTLTLDWAFDSLHMAEMELGMWAQELKVPMIAVEHPEHWVFSRIGANGCIPSDAVSRSCRERLLGQIRRPDWKLFSATRSKED